MKKIWTLLVGEKIALGVILSRGPIVPKEPIDMGHIHHQNPLLVKTFSFYDSLKNSIFFFYNHKRKNPFRENLCGEFRKEKTPTFDDEVKFRQDVEAWLLGMRNYLQVHDYSRNMKVKVAILNLNGGASICWRLFGSSSRRNFNKSISLIVIVMVKSKNSMS